MKGPAAPPAQDGGFGKARDFKPARSSRPAPGGLAASPLAAARTARTAEATASTATGPAATALRALTLLLALAREAVGADVAERGLHRIGLRGTAGC